MKEELHIFCKSHNSSSIFVHVALARFTSEEFTYFQNTTCLMESDELTEDPSSVVNTNIFSSVNLVLFQSTNKLLFTYMCVCVCPLVPGVFGGLGSIFLPSSR